MSIDMNTAELLDLEQIKKEELEAEFHVWLQSHFDSSQDKYINALVEAMDEILFCKLAEQWASENKPNKVFY